MVVPALGACRCDKMGSETESMPAARPFERTIMSNEATVHAGSAGAAETANIASYIDHTLLKPEASEADVLKVCAEAAEYKFKSVCVNPIWVKTVTKALKGSGVLTCSVVGFPLGASTSETKAFETKQLVEVRLRPHRFVTAGADVCIVCRVRRCVW